MATVAVAVRSLVGKDRVDRGATEKVMQNQIAFLVVLGHLFGFKHLVLIPLPAAIRCRPWPLRPFRNLACQHLTVRLRISAVTRKCQRRDGNQVYRSFSTSPNWNCARKLPAPKVEPNVIFIPFSPCSSFCSKCWHFAKYLYYHIYLGKDGLSLLFS